MTGEADVEFATHEDAVAAMSKDKANMRKWDCCNTQLCAVPPGSGMPSILQPFLRWDCEFGVKHSVFFQNTDM